MNYGIKVSKQGYSVLNDDSERRESSGKPLLPHIQYALALTYLFGAKKQITRYQVATSKLEANPAMGVYDCLHEVSTLFEDLSTVGKYAEKCGHKNDLHKLWLDIRNHIRHDVREEFDKEDSRWKNGRTERLKLNPRLQTSIGFDIDAIKVGEITVEIKQINDYLEWAENIIGKVFKDAKEKGYIH